MLNHIIPERGMVISESVRFQAGEYDFREGDGLIVAGDDIVIDGNGAALRGGCEAVNADVSSNLEEFGYGNAQSPNNARQLGFCGVGLRMEGCSRVTVMNLKLSGFDLGALIENCVEITLIGCDLSGCFHDPAWGWDEHGEHGAILMRGSDRCKIINCRANNVWDALHMRHCNDCLIVGCDFSHTSDTGLKLWHSCRNRIIDCDFSYGIRIDPGEVHARDSSCVLIESGSDDNWFSGNDMSHGGDGLFIRVLNGWMSCGNTFLNNDCSHANNNAIEAWADRNTYIGNKANYSSYGFWLGNSDYIVMEDNEIAFNGWARWHNNAPEAFGNAGVSVVNGSGSHSVIRRNHIHDNCGPGIAIRNTLENPSRHWIIAGNVIENNRDAGPYRGHGVYLRRARQVTLSGNRFSGNAGEEICLDGDVADVRTLTGEMRPMPPLKISLEGAENVLRAGRAVTLKASRDAYWDFGDDCSACGAAVSHTYAKPGMYPVSATACDGGAAVLAGMTLQVLPEDFAPLEVVAECGDAEVEALSGVPRVSALTGSEHRLELRLPEPVGIPEGRALAMHLAYFSDAPTDWDKETRYPRLVLHGPRGAVELTPTEPLLEMLYAPRSEMRGEGRVFIWPLSGCGEIRARRIGEGLEGGLTRIDVTYGGIGDAHSRLEIRALGLCGAPTADSESPDLAAEAEAEWEGWIARGKAAAVLGARKALCGDRTPRVQFEAAGAIGARFPAGRRVDRVECVFYENQSGTDGAHGETLPEHCRLELLLDGEWRESACGSALPVANAPTVFEFAPQLCEGVRVRFDQSACIARLSAYNSAAVTGMRICTKPRMQRIDAVEVKLNRELNGNGTPLGNLTVRVFSLDDAEKPDRCLFEADIAPDRIVPFAPLRIETPGLELREGERYALALGQTNRAKSRTEGDYYRWIGGHAGFSETFGILNGGEACPSDHDWGTGWLRVIAGEDSTDMTHHSDHVGARFGIEGMECRYQVFRAPEQTALLMDGRISGGGYALSGEMLIELPEAARVEAVDLYVLRAAGAEILLTDGNGCELCRKKAAECGRIRMELNGAEIRSVGIRADGEIVLSEIEVIAQK